jgi:hypothetical protein
MFRFTIRDVLWLTVVVALGCALWIQHHKREHELEAVRSHAMLLRGELILARHFTMNAYDRANVNWSLADKEIP